MYRNSQTTSTKCQYQAAHSNPVVWSILFRVLLIRFRDTVRNVDPMITCSPWNPVAMKNVVPKAESDRENGASLYSNACNAVNSKPSVMVVTIAFTLVDFFDSSRAWCAHVIVTPEDSSSNVFSRGTFIGLKG